MGNYMYDLRTVTKGIVIHNDAGTRSGYEWVNSIQGNPNFNYGNGFAHYYISAGEVGYLWDDRYVAYHTGNYSGNTEYIGVEICQSYSADDYSFMQNEEEAFRKVAQLCKDYGLYPNYDTIKLHRQFVATACPHRSVELHNDAQTYFIERILYYYNGGGVNMYKTETLNVIDWYAQNGEICTITLDADRLATPTDLWFDANAYKLLPKGTKLYLKRFSKTQKQRGSNELIEFFEVETTKGVSWWIPFISGCWTYNKLFASYGDIPIERVDRKYKVGDVVYANKGTEFVTKSYLGDIIGFIDRLATYTIIAVDTDKNATHPYDVTGRNEWMRESDLKVDECTEIKKENERLKRELKK